MNTHFRKYQLLQLIRSRYEYDTKPQDLILPKLKTNLVIKKIELENNVNLIIKKRDDIKKGIQAINGVRSFIIFGQTYATKKANQNKNLTTDTERKKL